MLCGVRDHRGAPGAGEENEEDFLVRGTDVNDEDMSHNVHDRKNLSTTFRVDAGS